MKFNEEEDNLSYEDHQESIFWQEHDGLLSERAELVKTCMRSHSKTQAVAKDILDAIQEIVDLYGEIVTISMSLHAAASLAQAGDYDAFDMSHEVFGASDHLLDVVQRADASSQNMLDSVRELIDGRGDGHEQG